MPEGDSVHRTCARLHEALAGGALTRTELRVPRLATVDLTGRTVREVRSCGKHILIRLGAHEVDAAGTARAMTLHCHLMMDGRFSIDGKDLRIQDMREAAPSARHHDTARIVLEAQHADGRTVRAVGHEVQQVRLVPTAQESDLIGHLGPDLLDPTWGEEHVARVVTSLQADPERGIGEALMDQRILAGIGTIYRSEICFLHRTDPFAPVGQVDELPRLVDLARRLLWVNRDRTPRSTTAGAFGRRADLWVYGREHRPCRRCGTRIRRGRIPQDEIIERVVYWCPSCQTGR